MSYMLGSLYYHWATPKTHPTLIVAWYVPGPRDILSVRTYCSRGEGRVKHTHKCAYMRARAHPHASTHQYTQHTYMCTHTQPHMCIYADTCAHTCIHAHKRHRHRHLHEYNTHKKIDTCTQINTHIYMHMDTDKHTHTYMRSGTDTPLPMVA